MLKKYKYPLIIISTIAIGLSLYRNCSGKVKKSILITYDKQYVQELSKINEDSAFWKERGVLLKKVDELEDSLAEVYQITGENGIGWSESSPGDFVRINIKLRNGRIVQFDSLGGWLSNFEEIDWIPSSPKIQKHPYGITLDMGQGDQILILTGATPDVYLTLIYIGKDTAEIIFNKEIVALLAIAETEKGYRLKGQLYFDEYVGWEDRGMATSYPGRQYEIIIENAQLSFHELPKFDMNRLKLPIHFDKKQIELLTSKKVPVDSNDEEVSTRKIMDGTIEMLSATLRNYWYDENRTKRLYYDPGDFCIIDFSLPSGVWVGITNQEGGWVKPSPQIKLPQQPTKIIKHEYGIILDIGGGNHILALTGYKYTQEPSFLTLICVTPDNADMVFNKKVELLEVQETAKGYRLLGKLPVTQEGQAGRLCEVCIEKGELTFKEL